MYVLYLRMILSSLCLAPYLTLPCLAPLQSFPVLPLLFLCSDPGPQCTSMHTLHFTLYIPYLTLLCLAPFQSVRVLPVLFLCFDPRPQCTSRTDHTLHDTLYTLSPPNLHAADSWTLLQSFLVILVLQLLFFCFDPPNARPCTDQGGIEPHRHPIATWHIGRKTDHRGHPKWLVNCLKLAGFGTLPPRPPLLTSFAMSNFSQAWQLAFVIYIYIYIHMYSHIYHIPYATSPPPQHRPRCASCLAHGPTSPWPSEQELPGTPISRERWENPNTLGGEEW